MPASTPWSSPPASSRRMGGIDKLTGDRRRAPAARLVRWRRSRRRRWSTGSCSSSRRSGSRRSRAAGWLPAGRPVVAGGDDAPGVGRGRACATSTASIRTGGDRPGARPRRRPAAGHRRRSSRPSSDAVAAARGGAARPARRRDAQAGRRRAGRRDRRPRRRSPPRRRPRARAGALLLDAWEPVPAGRPPAFTDEAALLEACTITVHAIPGEPSEPQGDAARRPRAGSSSCSRARRAAGRVRPRQPPVRSRVSAPPRRRRDRRRARARGPLRRRRGAARGRRRAARRGGPWATSAACSPATSARRARIDSGLLLRDVVARLAGAGLAPGVGGRHDHRRAPAPGRPPRRDAGGDRRRARPGRGARQRQGVDRQPRGRRGGGPDDLGAGRRHGAGRRA